MSDRGTRDDSIRTSATGNDRKGRTVRTQARRRKSSKIAVGDEKVVRETDRTVPVSKGKGSRGRIEAREDLRSPAVDRRTQFTGTNDHTTRHR